MRHLRKRNPSDIETALAGAYRSTTPKSRAQTAKEKLVQQLTEAYRASDDDPEGQKIILDRLRRLAVRNPLSEKRRGFFKERLLKHVGLDPESIEGITPQELGKRQKDLEIILDMIHQADPSFSGEHAGWIIKLFLHNKIRLPEDTEKLNTRLTEFAKLKHKIPVELRDLNRYPDYPSLAETIDQYSGVLGKREEERVRTEEGQEVIFEGELSPQGPPYRVIKVTTTEASAKLARHTDWCIKDPRAARDYLANGPLYFIDKNNKRYLLAWSDCVVDAAIAPLWKRFQSLMAEHQTNSNCMVCSIPGSFLCKEHIVWEGSLLDANVDRQSFKEMAGFLSEVPVQLQNQVENLLQFRAPSNPDGSPEIDLQIMDVYDRPANLTSDELELTQKIYATCTDRVEFFIRLCDHLNDPALILQKGAAFLEKANPDQLLQIYKAHLIRQLPEDDGFDFPTDYLITVLRNKRIKVLRWKEAEPYIFQSPSAAYEYYSLVERKLQPNETEFKELIRKHLAPTTPAPAVKKISTNSNFRGVGFPDAERHRRRVNEEYQRRATELESWKIKQQEKFAAKQTTSLQHLQRQLRDTNKKSHQQQQIVDNWEQNYIPRLEAGEIQLVDIVQPLFKELRKVNDRAAKAARQILLPYVDYYGKGYLVSRGKNVSLDEYISLLRRTAAKASRRSSRRRVSRRGHISDRVKKRETTALLIEVEKAYKKKIKVRR